MFSNDKQTDYSDNCLLYALKLGGLDDVKYEAAKTYVKTAHVTKKALQELCDKLDIVIELETEKTSRNCKTMIGSGNKNGSFFELGLIEGHFFLNEQVSCTSYAMENYNLVKNMKDWNKIFGYEVARNASSETRNDTQHLLNSFRT